MQSLVDTLNALGAPFQIPEDWIMLCDNDDLRHLPLKDAKKLLAECKNETAHRWLLERFDPAEIDLELSQEQNDNEGDTGYDEHLLKQKAIISIEDVVNTVESLRRLHAKIPERDDSSAAHRATIAARLQFGYAKERPDRSDCFDEDVRRQCRAVIDELYG